MKKRKKVITINQDDLNTLPAALREKKRYLIFEIIAKEKKSLGEVIEAIWDSLLSLLGEADTAKANPWIVKDLFEEDSQRGGLRVNHNYVEEARLSLALISEIEGERVALKVIGVTGTMRSARKKYLD